jgi:signal transduction histidine kinase
MRTAERFDQCVAVGQFWTARARSFFRLLLLLSLLCLVRPALSEPLTLTQAQVVIDGDHTSHPVTLPYPWDARHPGAQGRASFDLSFRLSQTPEVPWVIFIPKLGNAYEVRLNGQLLERRGDLEASDGNDFSLSPRILNVPPELLSVTNRVQVRIRADVGRRGGLSRIVVGPEGEVAVLYQRELHLGSTGLLLVTFFSLIVGVLSLALWTTQPRVHPDTETRRDPLYLYAGLAELFWTLRVGFGQIEQPPLPWPWWGVVPVVALGIWSCFMTFFCMELTGWRHLRLATVFRRGIIGLMLSGPVVASFALGWGHPLVLTLWYAALAIAFLGFGTWFVQRALRTPSLAQRLVATAVVVNVGMGLRDLYVFRINPGYPSHSSLYYASTLFGLALGYVLIMRFRAVSAQVRELMHTLTSRIAERERELNSSYQRLEALAREQERSSERTRILRDMHDGVGSYISAAIRQLQSGRARHEDVLQTLRESLDQLKLTIDAMHLPRGDVAALLANLRYRLEPRFLASDVKLQWAVELLDPVLHLDAQAMRHLQFMVFEALSNVLQHAQASLLRIEGAMTEEGVRLRIVDNGRGFDVLTPLRKGLLSLHERAQAIGAQVSLQSQPGCSVVEILIR